MTDSAGSVPPFPGFPGFPPAEMLDRMWGMMRLTPFGSAFPGGEPGAAQGFGQGLGPSLSMMSDMMTPLTNIEELDKRVTDLRAVEQWLKLNLNMLQSAIQALEVQRATLSTLRAFGAFAQAQMSPPPAQEAPSAQQRETASAARDSAPGGEADAGEPPGFDASAWWNLLQSQFNQLAQFAMAQPAAAAQAAQAAAGAGAGASAGSEAASPAKSAPKRGSGGSSGGGASAGAAAGKTSARTAKKAPSRPQ